MSNNAGTDRDGTRIDTEAVIPLGRYNGIESVNTRTLQSADCRQSACPNVAVSYFYSVLAKWVLVVAAPELSSSFDMSPVLSCCQDGADGSMLADNLFELKNGCICCTVKDDLVTTLETLLERRNKFDYIIIETTGLANPVGAIIRAPSSCLPFIVHVGVFVQSCTLQ